VRPLAAWLVVVAVCGAAELRGQSLGEIARKDKAKRARQGPACTRVITDEDLRLRHMDEPAATPAPPATAASPAASSTPKPAAVSSPAPTLLELAERHWRQRAADLREAVGSADARLAAIQRST
jgi:hypothetical protein